MFAHRWRVQAAVIARPAIPARFRPALLRRLGVTVGERCELYAGAHLGSPRIAFGDDVFVNHGLFYDGEAPATIGARVAFGPQVRLITATHAIGLAARRCDPTPIALPVSVGDGAWLAAGVTVLPGVTVASGCVIGAGAVVTSSTEPDGLYVGMPARRVRDL